MIKNDFYADDWTGTGTDDLVGTKSVNSLNLTDKNVDPMAAYYMGKIDKNQNLMYRATFSYDSDAGIYKLEYNNQHRVNWGYTYCDDGANYNPSFPKWRNDLGKWMSIGSLVYFINSMKYYKATMSSVLYLISCHLYDFSGETTLGTGEHIRYATNQYSGSFNATVNGFYDVFYGSASWTVTINSVTYTLSKSNWNSTGCYFDVGDNKRIYVYQIIKNSGVNYNCTYYNNHNFYLNLTYSIDSPDRVKSYLGCKLFRQFSHYVAFDSSIEMERGRVYTPIPSNDIGQSDWLTNGQESVFGIKPFNVTRVSLQYACTTSPTDHTNEYIINSNDDLIKCSSSSTGSVRINYFCDLLGWVKFVLGIAPKWATGKKSDGTAMTANNNSPEYLPNTAVPLFTRNDVPTGNVVKTDTYRELEPQLRPWQKYGYNITDDEFDPEGGGGGGGDDDWDPDTATGDDTNDYEENPTTQLHQPFLGAIGQTWWAFEAVEWSSLVNNVKEILSAWEEWVAYHSSGANSELEVQKYKIGGDTRKSIYCSGFVSNPIDCVAAVVWYPFDITLMLDGSNTPFIWGGTAQVKMTGFSLEDGPTTEQQNAFSISGYLNNAYWLDGGFTDYFKHYENFIDYNPYCSAELYIPYCGSVKIDPQQYVGHHISVRYLIDFPTGACLALIYRDNLVVDTIPGQIGVSVAMSMPDYLDYSGRHMQAATSVKANKLQTMGSIFGTLGSAMSGNIPGMLQGAIGISEGMERQNLVEYQLANTLLNQKTITTATPTISTGNEQVCRLVLYQPRWIEGYSKDNYGNYGHTTGFATIENDTLTNFKGLTIAESIDTSGIGQATEKEKAMIAKAFKGGVYMPD